MTINGAYTKAIAEFNKQYKNRELRKLVALEGSWNENKCVDITIAIVHCNHNCEDYQTVIARVSKNGVELEVNNDIYNN